MLVVSSFFLYHAHFFASKWWIAEFWATVWLFYLVECTVSVEICIKCRIRVLHQFKCIFAWMLYFIKSPCFLVKLTKSSKHLTLQWWRIRRTRITRWRIQCSGDQLYNYVERDHFPLKSIFLPHNLSNFRLKIFYFLGLLPKKCVTTRPPYIQRINNFLQPLHPTRIWSKARNQLVFQIRSTVASNTLHLNSIYCLNFIEEYVFESKKDENSHVFSKLRDINLYGFIRVIRSNIIFIMYI